MRRAARDMRRRMARQRGDIARASLVVVPFAVSWSAAASAEPALPELDWRVPTTEDCPSQKDVLAEVGTLLRHSSGSRQLGRTTAQVTRDGNTWIVRLTPGDRVIEAESCRAAASAVAFVVAVAIDPNVATAPPAEPKAAPKPAPTSEAQHTSRARLGLAAVVDSAALPGLAWGGQASVSLLLQPAYASVRGTAWLPQRSMLAGAQANYGGYFTAWSGEALIGAAMQLRNVHVGPEGGLELYHLSAESRGARDPGRGSGTWAAVVLGGVLRYAVSPRVALRLGLGVSFPITRPDFVIDGVGTVHRPAGASARAALGADVDFL